MPARLSAFVIWALVAASAVFWGMRLLARAPAAPPHTVAAGDVAPQRADLTRLFGAPPAATAPAAPSAPSLASRFQLTGVVAPRSPRGPGIALIAVDGKTPRAYRVGATIDDDLVVQSVSHRSVEIGPARGEPAVVLEMPLLPTPATGTLPPVGSMTPPAPPPPPVAVRPPVMPVPGVAPTPPPAVLQGAPGALQGAPGALPRSPAAPVPPPASPGAPGRYAPPPAAPTGAEAAPQRLPNAD